MSFNLGQYLSADFLYHQYLASLLPSLKVMIQNHLIVTLREEKSKDLEQDSKKSSGKDSSSPLASCAECAKEVSLPLIEALNMDYQHRFSSGMLDSERLKLDGVDLPRLEAEVLPLETMLRFSSLMCVDSLLFFGRQMLEYATLSVLTSDEEEIGPARQVIGQKDLDSRLEHWQRYYLQMIHISWNILLAKKAFLKGPLARADRESLQESLCSCYE